MPTDSAALKSQSDELALLGLMQLVSPALPIGAFAFSQGLESAFELDWVRDEASLAEWLNGVLEDGLTRCELPVLARLHEAFDQADGESIAVWDEWLAATRETAELAAEDTRLGASLKRLLGSLDLLPIEEPLPIEEQLPSEDLPLPLLPDHAGYVTLFAYTAHARGVSVRQTLLGFAWAWLENQLAVACKALPLGHTAAQRVIEQLRPALVAAVDQALTLDDDELGPVLPGLALASALHETQYSRLFRS
ncbi:MULTISPECIES: urease accessory protein UreF [unclassified Halomonas]|uniref:urease accessory protein UreF n=1 Tax=unclassified Halomonas TaxID=2609666 RepID=UPI0009EDDA11|nr:MULTISPECIES: urease accessory protein UreF [unclassified Halomonas]MBT2786515.1 urease accessory protein UreF [Halomonas sp. ISL-106]MBT2797537.1 urease accessory protein UreF [Halomonas sp. ISL-104]